MKFLIKQKAILMILYLSDWNKYPLAIPDFKTSNPSYIKIANIFKKMGVKNHLFHLSLLQPELQGVDPFDPYIDQETALKVVFECKKNPWYFFREIVRLPAEGVGGGTQMLANRFNIAYFWCFYNHLTTISMIPRQLGKSKTMCASIVWEACIGTTNSEIPLLTKDAKLRGDNIEDIKFIIDALPPYLNPRGIGRDNNVKESVSINALKNEIVTAIAQESPVRAASTLRGHTFKSVRIDEFFFYKNIAETLVSVLPATTAARETAKKTGDPYATSYLSTAGYLNTKSGAFGYNLYCSGFRWTEKLYDAKDHDDLIIKINKNTPRVKEEYQEENSKEINKYPLVVLEFNHRQLGQSSDWLEHKVREYSRMMTPEQFAAEFLNVFALGSAESPIPVNIRNIMVKNRVDDFVYIEDEQFGFGIRWYVEDEEEIEEILQDRVVILGLDASEGIGRDATAMVFMDTLDGSVLGCCELSLVNIIDIGNWIIKLLVKYPKLFLVPERKSTGTTLIDMCLKVLPEYGIDPFYRIYNTCIDNPEISSDFEELILKKPLYHRDLNSYLIFKKNFGYGTTGTGRHSREMIYKETFKVMLQYLPDVIYDKTLINQYLALTMKNGRIDHSKGEHDDLVFAHLLAFWFLMFCNNQSEFDLDTSYFLTELERLETEKKEQSEEEKVEENRLKSIREKIEDLLEEADEIGPTNTMKLEIILKKIKSLTTLLPYSTDNLKFNTVNDMLYYIQTLKDIESKTKNI